MKAIIENYYNLGDMTACEQLYLGYNNESYIIEVESKGEKESYFFRSYHRGIQEEEILFEHAIIDHLVRKEIRLIASVIPCKDGKTYVKRFEGGESAFYAAFSLLPGDDPYTWVNPQPSEHDLKGAAAVLAQFHQAVDEFTPQGRRHEAKIIDLLPEIGKIVERCAEMAGDTAFDAYFIENMAVLQRAIRHTEDGLDNDAYTASPELVIHCDFHPGNLKFEDGEITGLFDFDWSKVDTRCFDVALAILYFCVSWEGEEDGILHLDKAANFLKAYQSSLRDSAGLKAMNDGELSNLATLIGASNIYMLRWTIEDFYSSEGDAAEYLIYLRHGIRLIKWLEVRDNWERLERMAQLHSKKG